MIISDNQLNFLKALTDLLQILAIIVAGIWAYFNWSWKRDNLPTVNFTLDLNLIGVEDEKLILEFIAYLENNGSVNIKSDVTSFELKIRYLKINDPLNNKIEFETNKKVDKFEFNCLNFLNPFKSEAT